MTAQTPSHGAGDRRGVVVTGAARGIGAAIMHRIAAGGALVVGLDQRGDELARTVRALPGEGHLALAGDVGDERLIDHACGLASATAGGLSGFVANAGFADPGRSVDYELDRWNELIRVNLTAAFIGARVAKRHITGPASIVMMSSISGSHGMAERAAYCASKAGISGLARALAVEWGAEQVRVNAIAPGPIMTDLLRELVDAGHAAEQELASRVPLGHAGRPLDVAEAVAYLLSDAAAYVNGVVLPVDGGWAGNGSYP